MRSGNTIIPALETDFIFSAIGEELGLVGAVAIILLYLLFVYRGLRIAIVSRDDFSRLLATGLSAIFGLQAFLIIGGVTKLIPLTGITLPFVSYGGSSIVANFALLALLLVVSDRAARIARPEAG
jgi:cell division protein FtsW